MVLISNFDLLRRLIAQINGMITEIIIGIRESEATTHGVPRLASSGDNLADRREAFYFLY